MDYEQRISELLKFFGAESWIIQVFIVVFATQLID